MAHTLKTGKESFSKLYQSSYFDYIAEYPKLQKRFDEHMEAVSTIEDPVVANHLPLSKKKQCIDIGGGKGGLIKAVLDCHPHIKGGVFELPNVSKEEINELSNQYGERFEAFRGSFFDSLTFKSDALILKRVLHDWDDKHCIEILSNMREALTEDGELYIVETL